MASTNDLNTLRIDHIGSLVRPAPLKNVFARHDRTRRMPIFIREGAERRLPALLAGGVISEQPIFGKESVDRLAIGNGRNGGGVIERIGRLDAGAIDGTLPEQFASVPVEALRV